MQAISLPRILRATIKDFYRLTKPGIIYGNDIAVVGGFLLAARWHIDPLLLIATVVGISLVMASGCVFNNFIDRDIDAVMERTKHRALVEGRIGARWALLYGGVLYMLGATTLGVFVNLLSMVVATFGFVVYVFFYSLWSKRYSVHSTVIGALSGAVPPVVGYTAVTNSLDIAAILLFVILAIWQLPHAFAIAIYRLKDYTAASIPVLPVAYGTKIAKIALVSSVGAFAVATTLLWATGYVGMFYLSVMSVLSVVWFVRSIQGFNTSDDAQWGRRMFLFSLIALVIFCVMISVDSR